MTGLIAFILSFSNYVNDGVGVDMITDRISVENLWG